MRSGIDPSETRSIAVAAAGLNGAWPGGVEGSLAAIRRLGSVQIDTISVVERAHGHVIRSRNAEYRADHIPALEAEPRRVIEYWSHAAAYLPYEDYRFCIPRMERIRADGHEWYRTDRAVARRVLDRVRGEGPLRAQDFEGRKKGSAGWWDWKPEKRALEYLFHAGQLVSVGRRAFQKVYDLPERALGSGASPRRPSLAEHASYYVDIAAASLGVFARSDVGYMRKDGVEGIDDEIRSRIEDGRLVELEIAGLEKKRGAGESVHFAAPEVLGLGRARGGELAYKILSPFDPMLIDRKRTARLFDRVVQLECYLPSSKRSFGYFALPLLEYCGNGDRRLSGLLDAKAERRERILAARRLRLDEPPAAAGGSSPRPATVAAALAAALMDYAELNGAVRVELGSFEAYDGRIERSLRAALAKLER
jgi:uncharacterized protein